MFRRSLGFVWLVALGLHASAAFAQSASSNEVTQPCDKACQQERLDAQFKAMDDVEVSRHPKPSNSADCAAYGGHDQPDVLLDVCAKLKYVRSLPIGTDTHFACPGDTSQLVGLSAERVRSILGVPDYEERETWHDESSQILRWTYFIGSPKPRTKGGGFPELSLHFKGMSKVDGVTCALSK
uniref:hypothetical protein n=1 Tax=Dyella soli TaxID=522319 RepID=UPI0013F440A7|nr:hypothetical protein [Dyella soli]